MKPFEELFEVADQLKALAEPELLQEADSSLQALNNAASEIARSHSGSWLGYQANVYYANLIPAPPGARFSQEWGLKDMTFVSMGSTGDWREFDPKYVINVIREKAGNPDISAIQRLEGETAEAFASAKSQMQSLLSNETTSKPDGFLEGLATELNDLRPLSTADIISAMSPKGQVLTRDMVAAGQRTKVPPHQIIKAEIAATRQTFAVCHQASLIARRAASHLERTSAKLARSERIGTNVFIGHGRSSAWRELKDFVNTRLGLPWDEFNRVPVAGVTNQARLLEMLNSAAVALIIMTAEDETKDGQLTARMNVIHEVGLFQGRLGFTKAIVLFEEGCQEFTNIQGLGQIRFPQGNIAACFEDVRQVLEREGLLS